MEDVSKVIEIAVGVILFIIAVTIAIFTYSKLSKATKDSLSINNMENNVIYSLNDTDGYVYTKQDIYFLMQDIIKQTNNDATNTMYNPDNIYKEFNNTVSEKIEIKEYNNSAKSLVTKYQLSNINNLMTYITDNAKYKIEYEYKYVKSDNANINSHLISKIIFTKLV